MTKKKVVYIGYSERMLLSLMESNLFQLEKIIYVPHRVNNLYLSILKEFTGKLLEINTKEDVVNIDSFISSDEVAVMYKFEYILPMQTVNHHRIINFHGGYLRTNRGAHAVVRSILNMENNTALSMYELTGGIDVGKLIAEHIVELDNNETPQVLNDKLQEGIPSLLDKLDLYLNGEIDAILVEGGKYYQKVQPSDYTIDPECDSFEKAYAILRSQVGYGGALLKVGDEIKPVLSWNLSYDKYNEVKERQVVMINSEGQCLIIKF